MSDKEKAAEEWANDQEVMLSYPYSRIAMKEEIPRELEKAFLAGAEWAEPKWIKCSERLPEFGDRILAYYSGSFYEVLRCVEGRHDDYGLCEVIFVDEHDDKADEEFTHWMPLPEAPKEEE